MSEFHRVRRLPPYVFEQVNKLKAKARAAGADIIDLGMGNPDLATPKHIVDKLVETVGKPRTNRYSASRGIPGLRRAQAGYYARRFGVKLDPETQVVATLGSKEGFANMAQAITAPGDVVLTPNPSYPIHAFGFLIAGGVIRSVPAEPSPEYFVALERALIHSTPKPIAVVVCYPSNPTAMVASLDFYKDLVLFAKKHEIFILSDLAYAEVYFDDNDRPPSVFQAPGAFVAQSGSMLADQFCVACPSGSFSAVANSAQCSPWRTCNAGNYVTNFPSATMDRGCGVCAEGTYTSGPNQSVCLTVADCPAGTEQTASASSLGPPVCTACIPGQYCAGGTAPAILKSRSRMLRFRFCFALLLVSLGAWSQDVHEFDKRITEFDTVNGMHFIVMERHDAPVVSFHTYVNVGSVDDPSGMTGLAHMFEHLAFKGTETIGTADWQGEKRALDEVDAIYAKLQAEQNKGRKADQSAVRVLQTQFRMALDRAQGYVRPNEFARIIEQNGGVGLNASTGEDATQYFYSLPSNRLELWFLMESQRFAHPVFREFYKERDVVMEERRMRVESSPQGRLVEEFIAGAFEAHPYRNPAGGWASDIAVLSRQAAAQFFSLYYAPANITVAIVGDVDPAKAKALAMNYFGPIPARPLPAGDHTEEPPQHGPKTALVYSTAQPLLIEGYKRPDQYDKDDPVFDIASMVLSSGRTSLMYKDMVQDKRVAVAAESIPTFPGGRYPNLFVLFVAPSKGHSVEENRQALDSLIQKLKTEKVDSATLERVKAQARVSMLRRFDSNSELASMLSSEYANYGNWRKLFTTLDDYKKVTADDIQRVARKYFTLETCTTAYSVDPQAAQPAAPAAAAKK